MSNLFMGLDVSTSIVGVTILKEDFSIVLMTHIDLRKIDDFWKKVDFVHDEISKLLIAHSIYEVWIEEPALGYSQGKTSAHTLMTLIRFNTLVSWKVRELLSSPKFITASHARKTCGILTQRVSKCGKTHKQQTADYLMERDLKHLVWPTKKRSSKIVDWAYDTMDSYVIAKSGILSTLTTQKK